MGRFFRALSTLAGFTVVPALAFRFGYVATGVAFREKAVALPFERFGLAVGTAAACFAVAAVCFLRWSVGLFKKRSAS
jgi:hypothetical protein